MAQHIITETGEVCYSKPLLGKAIHFRLLKTNIDNFRAKIPFSALSWTFKDALTITKHLGLSYLWIDSLCIIQDDPNDWLKESAQMSGIYGHSSVNIAATGARDGTVGCFLDAVQKKTDFTVRTTKGEKKTYNFAQGNFYDVLKDSPLPRRAWAFQERFLAPRTLHFTRTQTFFECKQQQACELFPFGTPPVFLDTHLGPRIAPLLSHFWPMVVTRYSAGDLTFAKDRLVAISGVAKWVSEQTAGEYLAGLWERDLAKQLLWFRKSHSNIDGASAKEDRPICTTNLTEYLAPSWSWGSIHIPVQFPEEDGTSDVIIIHCHTIPLVQENPFGQIIGGKLRISVTRIWRYTPGESEWELSARNSVLDLSNPHSRVAPRVIWDTPGPWIKLEPVYLLPVLTESSVEYLKGIALVRIGATQEFKRIGYWEGSSKSLGITEYYGGEFKECEDFAYLERRALTII